MIAAAAAGPSAYWYLTRATGFVSLILLTISVVLGVANVRRVRTATLPRFVLDAVHRNASLLAVAFLVAHIVTSVLDSFAPIKLIDSVIPFISTYRPIWLGLGTVAFDLLIAIVVTSLLRRHLGYGAWRATHWLAYAAWPVAVVHGLGTGSDTKTGWALVITGLCTLAVIVAAVARATAGWPAHRGARITALLASGLAPLALLVWLPTGPLAAGWAKRAGTPKALLPSTSAASNTTQAASSGGTPATSFSARVTGTSSQGPIAGGLEAVNLALSIPGQQLSRLDFRIVGQPSGGGVAMTSSAVSLGTNANPGLYQGRITALQGTSIGASVSGAGKRLRIVAQLQLDQSSNAVSGAVTVSPGASQ